ncbi:hypothetical protein BKH32_07775 [Actinomyces oris]|uniref:Transposase DDE domain-containing protein n=1 Tax=Actinomyces oris TaxID=544580 RepID=A0A1Q8I0B4_9ACTO|nr:hypothetical protein BKH32_07775 [Actinomyces oris]
MLRPGNAGSNTAADHVEIIRRALDQAGLGPRPGRKVLVRIDGAGGTKETIELLARRPGVLQRGVHASRAHAADPRAPSPRLPGPRPTTLTDSPGRVRTSLRPADLVDLTAWPKGMRVNRAPRAAPPGRPAALRGRGRLPADRLRHQHEGGSARRSRGASLFNGLCKPLWKD